MREKARQIETEIDSLFGDVLAGGPAPLVAAAHELKTPLAVIGHLVAMLRDEENLSDSEKDQYLQRIALSTERMSRLVDGFTLSYRLQDERQMALVGLEPVNMTPIVETVLHELSPLAKQLDQTLSFKIAAHQPLAVANKDLLSSVVTNLVDNALKHNPPKSQVDLRVMSRGNMIRSMVHDNGSELSRRDLLTLKKRLGKEVQPLSGRPGSSGLGLYIAHQLARAMGGNIGAICHRQTGATFFIDLQRSAQLSFL